jgi:flagellar basal-body rod protein FlgF
MKSKPGEVQTVNDMYAALSGAVALEHQLALVANNLANASTTGFKRDTLVMEAISPQNSFEQIWKSQIAEFSERTSPRLSQDFQYVHAGVQNIDLTPGRLAPSSNPNDFALEERNPDLNGRAFFVVEGPNGPLLTRGGGFALGGADGTELVLRGTNYPLHDEGGAAMTATSQAITIGVDGVVSNEGATLGTLRVVTVPSADQVQKLGQGLYQFVGAPGDLENLEANVDYRVQQSTTEQANINVIDEMMRLMEIQRAYTAMGQSIRGASEARGKLLSMVMRPAI